MSDKESIYAALDEEFWQDIETLAYSLDGETARAEQHSADRSVPRALSGRRGREITNGELPPVRGNASAQISMGSSPSFKGTSKNCRHMQRATATSCT